MTQSPGSRTHSAPRSHRTHTSIRVLVADQKPLDSRAMAVLIDSFPGFAVIGETPLFESLVETVKKAEPDVVVLDTWLSGPGGRTAVRDLLTELPTTRVLAVARHREDHCLLLNPPNPWDRGGEDLVLDCLGLAVLHGALGAVRRDIEPDMFRDALEAVARRRFWVDQTTQNRVRRWIDRGHTVLASRPLSSRERDVAALIAEGRSNKEIARSLLIAEPTVKKHVTHVMRKLHVEDRLQLGLYLAHHPLALTDE